jgi:hypothetical protein
MEDIVEDFGLLLFLLLLNNMRVTRLKKFRSSRVENSTPKKIYLAADLKFLLG